MTRPIFFLTDFGLADTYVGVVKAVILSIAPDAQVVDLTHDVPPQDVRAGAFALLTAVPYLPEDAVVLAVVDPGVGTGRRPIAVQAAGRTYVGPDNGLLSWAIRADLTPQPPLLRGEGEQAVVLDRPRFWRPTVSATFHGRDLFGPVAAHLARGVPLAEVGSPCSEIQTLPFPAVRRTIDDDGRVVTAQGEIVHVDRFGNLISNLTASDLPDEPTVAVAGRTISELALHFQATGGASKGERLIALIGSAGLLEIAVPNGSAAAALGIGVGASVTVTRESAEAPGC
ncbi:MAG TPA: SAM-dependent chlorinase/fluorinase [Chloroflexota bacterium]|nr:SAM-dependent chlorinase/fluorinase [Chloroflexota bacterium]